MSNETANPFATAVAEFRAEGARKAAEHQRQNAAELTLVNTYRVDYFPEIVFEFNQHMRESGYGITINQPATVEGGNGTSATAIKYSAGLVYAIEAVNYPSLTLTMQSDCKAYSSVLDEYGKPFVFDLQAAYDRERAREMFAAYFRDCLRVKY